MSGPKPGEFCAMLDALLSRDEEEESEAEDGVRSATISFDYLAVADELHSGQIRVAADAAEAGYREAVEALDQIKLEAEPSLAEEEVVDALFGVTVDPDVILQELGLDRVRHLEDFGRIRRAFALHNHPDRHPDHLRDLAQERMQVANRLIDDARAHFARGQKAG